MDRTRGLIGFVLTGGLVVALAAAFLATGSASSTAADSAVWYVAPGALCNGASPCFASVQQALDAAGHGDEIRVAEGIYTDVHARVRSDVSAGGFVTQVAYISKTVNIRGGYSVTDWTAPDPAANVTTLDAHGSGRVLYITGEITPTIEGILLTHGDATGLGGDRTADHDAGGGVYVFSARATISNNQVISNVAAYGGGLYLYNSAAVLSGNTIASNAADRGGGLCLDTSPARLTGNVVLTNTAGGPGGLGGGLYLRHSKAALTGNTVSANSASHLGGGLRLNNSDAALRDNRITFNMAGDGGGLHMQASDAALINNVITDNRVETIGSGAFIQASSTQLLHTTVARNGGGDGSGVYIFDGSSVALIDTIVTNQSVGIKVVGDNSVSVDGVLWHSVAITVPQAGEDVINVAGQYAGDPAFAPDGYHLTADSAAIDKGVFSAATSDIDGDARPDRCFPDLGADEFLTGVVCERLHLPMVLR